MVNGNEKQCNQAISQVREELGQDATPQIEWRYCDMTDLIQVQEVFSALSDELPRLDICIFGSGIDAQHFQTDLHCIDAYFGITWLGHFYASNLLWPLLRKTSRMPGNKTAPRVIFEAPEQQFLEATTDGSSSDEDDFRRYEEEVSSEIFRRSRTSLILGVRHGLAERIVKRHHDNIYALAVQPTKAAVDADDDALPRRDSHSQSQDLCDRALDSLAKGGMPIRSTSRAVLYAATSPDVENEYLNGAYLTDAVSFFFFSLLSTKKSSKLTSFLSAGRFRKGKRSRRRRSVAGTGFLGH